MFRFMLLLPLAVLIGCQPAATSKLPLNASRKAPEGFRIGAPVTYKNLTVFPVVSLEPRQQDRFITLDEGLKAGTIEIRELGGAAANANDSRAPQIDNNAPNAPPQPQRNNDDLPNPSLPPRVSPSVDPECEPESESSNGDATQTEGADPPTNNDEPTNNATNDPTPQIPELEPHFFQNVGGQGNSVNTLVVINNSDKPLYLMPGEIIIGGSQDRTIGRELVIQPDGKPVPIDVFCVEHGRWNDRDTEQTLQLLATASSNDTRAGSVAVAEITIRSAMEANAGKFIASIGNAGKATRYAVYGGEQGKVWEKVAATNVKSGVNPDGGGYTANYSDPKSVARLEAYIEKVQTRIATTKNVVGVIVAINGKPDTMDIFESTPLFKKLWPKLLKSYALDAANEHDDDVAHVVCTSSEACEFLWDATTGKVDKSEVKGGIATHCRSNSRLASFVASEVQPADASAAPADSFGTGIHASAYAH
ncbi:MAG: hypothetical protein IH991_15930 [Planctomycetes bacterium]|nr:hypothetical protein [Planctomycetota bacterium]